MSKRHPSSADLRNQSLADTYRPAAIADRSAFMKGLDDDNLANAISAERSGGSNGINYRAYVEVTLG